MKDFFKYLTVGNETKEWGLYLNVAGVSKTLPEKEYPSREHPSGYYFNYKNGRVLNEYQLNYITEGSGVFETTDNSYKVESGSLMIIRKGKWHRYKPDMQIGWTENYIGFDGTIADHFLKTKSVLQGNSVIPLGKHPELIDTYYKIFDLILDEKPGYQEISSGMIIKLLGHIVATQKQRDFTSKPLEKAIQNLRFDMRMDIVIMPELETYAAKCNVSTDYFRNMFKKYTGVSPHQYHLDLKLMRAKELLLTSNKSVKEICFELGFQSAPYFNRFFKKKIGVNPGELRNSSTITKS